MTGPANEHAIWPLVEAAAPRLVDLSHRVWATPETCYAERQSVAAHAEELRAQGFEVTEAPAGIPTAVIGEAGHGGPVIAFLGEFDALAGLSQQADLPEQRPVIDGANGHGCGHNLLGSASMLAAVALRDWLEQTGTPGTVRYYGCPAEEGGAGKTFMVRDGLFSDVDIAITWHPHCMPVVLRGSSLANTRVDFTFEGRAAHAAGAPHLGRSALDAMELMNVGVNYLREHMPDSARLHYAIIDGGGISPNVVQARAKVRYVVRSDTVPEMMSLLDRVGKVAQGAALMTETQVTQEVLAAVSNLLPNDPLCAAMQANLDALGPVPFDAADRDYAARFQATMSPEDIADSYRSLGVTQAEPKVLADFVAGAETPVRDLGGSTDVADVSWVVPTVQLMDATAAIGTQLHSWQMTAQGKSAPAAKGMIHAAQVMAMTGMDAVLDPDLRARAWADLRARGGAEGYVCPLTPDAEPPVRAMAAE
ncbi:M20 family metallopeptidase [Marinibacterium profundimaris]|uniref:Amidohydrolase n=1 Tax=Marinibacterium profundimaris TaxID=1679460 RepID=A0A225NK87_9RHOB|nr:M20 family metallopeptidase [Marinibacterium profundimaris]OWU73571.1 amidohydrolase [Marinibacterium profundimaris]